MMRRHSTTVGAGARRPCTRPCPAGLLRAVLAGVLLLPGPGPAGAEASESPLQALVEASRNAGSHIDAERYDIAALAARLASPRAAFEFVRDSIDLDVYPGVLRGGDGALASRAGNAWDRALLLRDLLSLQRVSTRLARGKPSSGNLEKLYQRSLKSVPAPESPGRAAADSPLAASCRRAAEVLLGKLDGEIGKEAIEPREVLLEELEDHVWAQAKVDGAWVDLDPSLPSAAWGAALAAPASVLETVPQESFQMVEFSVTAMHSDKGKTASQRVLSVVLRAAEAARAQLTLFFAPGASQAGAATGVLQRIEKGGESVRPMFAVDGTLIKGTPFLIKAKKDGAGAFFFGGGGGGKKLERVTLTVSSTAPGGSPVKVERTLLDSRRPDGGKRIGGLPQELTGAHTFIVNTGASDLAEYIAAVQEIPGFAYDVAEAARTNAELPHPYMVWPLAMAGRTLEMLSSHDVVSAVNAASPARFYTARPRVIGIYEGVRVAKGRQDVLFQVDLMVDELRALAAGGPSSRGAARSRALFGVMEAALEGVLARNIFSLAPPEKIAWGCAAAMKPADLEAVDRSSASRVTSDPDARACIERALASGHVVLAARGARNVWWEISPATGRTRALLAPVLGGSYAVGGSAVMSEAARNAGGGVRAAGGSLGSRTTWVIREMPDGRILSASEADIAAARAERLAAERAGRFRRPPRLGRGAGGNVMGEYLTLLLNVSIPISVSLSVIGSTTAGVATFSYLAIARELRWGPFE